MESTVKFIHHFEMDHHTCDRILLSYVCPSSILYKLYKHDHRCRQLGSNINDMYGPDEKWLQTAMCIDINARTGILPTHFNIVASMKDTGFPEQPSSKYTPLVEKISHRICILENRIHVHVVTSI